MQLILQNPSERVPGEVRGEDVYFMLRKPMIIPYRQLSQATLQGLLEEFVTRDGTDYGEFETPIQTRVNQVRRQLELGGALIVYSESEGRCTILPADQATSETDSSPADCD